MFFPGQKVICINDRFHRSIVEYVDRIPRRGAVYTVKRVVPAVPEAVTREPGLGLMLVEAPALENQVCFSAWRFEPVELDEPERADAAIDEPVPENLPLTPALVGQAFLHAGSPEYGNGFPPKCLHTRMRRGQERCGLVAKIIKAQDSNV